MKLASSLAIKVQLQLIKLPLGNERKTLGHFRKVSLNVTFFEKKYCSHISLKSLLVHKFLYRVPFIWISAFSSSALVSKQTTTDNNKKKST